MPKGDGIRIPQWQPGQPSRWVVVGGAGYRVPDLALAVAATARLKMLERGVRNATIHEAHCGLGKADASPVYFPNAARPTVGECTCSPTEITRD